MTVAELIAMQTFPAPMRVVVHGYEQGYDDIALPAPVHLRLNVNGQWFYGPHAAAGAGEEFDELAIKLIGLRRNREGQQ